MVWQQFAFTTTALIIGVAAGASKDPNFSSAP
jgi:hypothetical protein